VDQALLQRIGEHGEGASGPPWIFGLRGAPREAPENTRAGLSRAVALGLDGVSYDVRTCAGGELVLCADASLDRTTDGTGALAAHGAGELHQLDAGGWFSREFAGERLAWLDDALALHGNAAGTFPQHLIELREPAALPEIARRISALGRQLSVRVQSSRRSSCREARDLGLSPLLATARADEDDRRFARDERLAAVGARLRAWDVLGRNASWDAERFCLDVDDPDELLEACRLPFNGLTTTEPRRALAVRALVALAPADRGPYPLQLGELLIEPATSLASEGEWCGRWEVEVRARNPFDVEVEVELALVVRRGAFDAPAFPQRFPLAVGEERKLVLRITGGSWSPGGDPLVVASFALPARDGEPRAFLSLDAPLRRVREARLSDFALRLALLREAPRERAASVTIRRHRSDLLAAIEDPGGLDEPRLFVHLDGEVFGGARGLRAPLPEDFDRRPRGVPFSIAVSGRRATPRGSRVVVRRWAGGLPDTLAAGDPGRLRAGT
jgi:glycerophosphoryl diester phosphodiesterase